MIGSRLGLLAYLLYRNDAVWKRLSQTERDIVFKNNARHNSFRPDYADPNLYGGGKTYDTGVGLSDLKAKALERFLKRTNPESVLEVGFGSGYRTRTIVEHPSVKSYTGVDINPAFIEFLQPRLAKLQKEKSGFTFELLVGNASLSDLSDKQYDAIIFLSAVHHIPDRERLFKSLEERLTPGGHIFAYEPAHYLPRMTYLLAKFWRQYRFKAYWSNPENYGTHHFCTIEEFRHIQDQVPALQLTHCHFYRVALPWVVRKGLYVAHRLSGGRIPAAQTDCKCDSILRLFAQRMIVEFEKRGQISA